MSQSATLSRRRMLKGLSALAAAPAIGLTADSRQSAASPIIDVHAHSQPAVLRALGMPGPMNAWSLQKHLDDMGAAGVARSLLSITTPGVPETGERARMLARGTNDEAAKLAADNGGRIGFFIAVPMDNVDAALKEIEYGFDVLKAPGVGLFTSYGAQWLGDKRFDRGLTGAQPPQGHRLRASEHRQLLRTPHSRSRRHGDRIRHGHHAGHRQLRVSRRCAPVSRRSHGVEPFRWHDALSHRALRWGRQGACREGAGAGRLPRAGRALLLRHRAVHAGDSVARALRELVPVDHIVFGSDYPFRTGARTCAGSGVGEGVHRQRTQGHLRRQRGAIPA